MNYKCARCKLPKWNRKFKNNYKLLQFITILGFTLLDIWTMVTLQRK